MPNTTLDEAVTALWNLHDRLDQKLDDIQAREDAAFTFLSSTARSVWVDPVNGDDASLLGDAAAPVQTVKEAATRSFQGGRLVIRLMGDVVISEEIKFTTNMIHFKSDGAVTHEISFAAEIDPVSIFCPRFVFQPDTNTIYFQNVRIASQQMSAHVVAKHMISSQLMVTALFYDCEFSAPAGSDLAVFGGDGLKAIVVDNSPIPAEFDGLWLQGVAANTDPATVPLITGTNLPNL